MAKPPKVVVVPLPGEEEGQEVVGFFMVLVNKQPELQPGFEEPRPVPYMSFAAAVKRCEAVAGCKLDFKVVQVMDKFPVAWAAVAGVWQMGIAYIGSFRYWSGREVDIYKVGTANETTKN